MVGRLVEDEQIRPGEQRAGQRDAAFFPAGQAAREALGVGRVEVGDERLDAVPDIPAVEVVDVREQFVGAGVVGGAGLVFGDEVEHLLRAGQDVLVDGAGVVELEILRQIAGDEFAAADDLARRPGRRPPAAMRRNVDLPVPLRPTRPTRSPSLMARVARSRMVCTP